MPIVRQEGLRRDGSEGEPKEKKVLERVVIADDQELWTGILTEILEKEFGEQYGKQGSRLKIINDPREVLTYNFDEVSLLIIDNMMGNLQGASWGINVAARNREMKLIVISSADLPINVRYTLLSHKSFDKGNLAVELPKYLRGNFLAAGGPSERDDQK